MWTCARAPSALARFVCGVHPRSGPGVGTRTTVRFLSVSKPEGCVRYVRLLDTKLKGTLGAWSSREVIVYFIVIKFFLSSVIELRTTKEIARSRSGGLVSRLCHVTHSIVKKTETAASRLVRVSAQSLHTALRTAFKKPYGLHMVIGGLLPQRGGGGRHATRVQSYA